MQFDVPADDPRELRVESTVVAASWASAVAIQGRRCPFELRTAFVGHGAPVTVRALDPDGREVCRLDAQVRGNRLRDAIEIPTGLRPRCRLRLEVELPRHGLQADGGEVEAFAPIEAHQLQWNQAEARRGDVVALRGRVDGVPNGMPILVVVHEHDRDGAHDRLLELPATVEDGAFEIPWEFQYVRDTDDIPTHGEMEEHGDEYEHPEYFFAVKVGGVELHDPQGPSLLRFCDFVELRLVDRAGRPVPREAFEVTFADGSTRRGELDAEGFARLEDVPPGCYRVQFDGLPGFDVQR